MDLFSNNVAGADKEKNEAYCKKVEKDYNLDADSTLGKPEGCGEWFHHIIS
jgi:hypothetical protein